MPPGAPPLPGDYVNPEEFKAAYDAWLASVYAWSYSEPYSSISNFAWDTFATQPNWVEIPTPRQDPELPEVIVYGTTPVSPNETFESPRDFEGYTYNPQTGVPYPPTWQMNDEEYATFLGGGDSAYDQMWVERHPDEPLPDVSFDPDESFTTPMPRLNPYIAPPKPTYTPPQPPEVVPRTIPKTYPGYTPREIPGGNPFKYVPPETVALPETAGWLTRLLPWLTFFVPLPAGPRELDEAPEWWVLPPAVSPKPRTVTPLPTFTEVEPIYVPDFQPQPIEFPEPDRRIFIDPGDSVRRIVQPVDDPGMFADPGAIPEFPFPDFEIPAEPKTRPRTDWPTPDPYRPALPDTFAPPWTATPTEPGVPPRVDTPPRVSDPYIPPFVDPFTPDPFVDVPTFPGTRTAPPGVGTPVDVFTLPPPFFDSPGLPPFSPPNLADPCNCKPCSKKKDKKDKKKRQPRTVCYEGHYVETAWGLTKKRGKEIPCY